MDQSPDRDVRLFVSHMLDKTRDQRVEIKINGTVREAVLLDTKCGARHPRWYSASFEATKDCMEQ